MIVTDKDEINEIARVITAKVVADLKPFFESIHIKLLLLELRLKQLLVAFQNLKSSEAAAASRAQEIKFAEALALLPTIPLTEASMLTQMLQSLQLKSMERKSNLTRAATLPLSTHTTTGYRSKSGDGQVIKRYYERGSNRYKGDRELQLLKQASTLVYFALEKHIKKPDKNLVEVQMMHVTYGDKNFIFISVNETDVSQYFKDVIGSTAESVKQLLTTDLVPSSNEGKIRSKRYTKKLSYRLFGDAIILKGSNRDDLQKANAVAETLKKPWKILDINARPTERVKEVVDKNGGGVFYINNQKSRYKERHAEECLVDIAEDIYEYAESQNIQVYTSICGKKRPCLSCTGRMTSVIDHFPAHPGYVWLHAVAHQPPAVVKRTFETIFKTQSCVTIDGRGKTTADYGSASDSSGPEFN